MRHLWLAATSLVLIAAAPPPPLGKLPDAVKPTAYRLDLTVDPAKPDFTGHAEIDAVVARPTSTVFMHGLGLTGVKASVSAGGKTVPATYAEVDPSGVVRLDLAGPLPAGKATFKFDYTGGFREGAEGLFHKKVGDDWYAWTQFEAIDARRMFPGFDEPGFKTPFTVTLTVPSGSKAFANTPETGTAANGAMTVHRFAATKPLPTYLVAIGVGPFDVVETNVPANAVRKAPLPFRVIATKGQAPRMAFAAAEGPKLLTLLEQYFGRAYPFEKLDFLASPIQGGAMENAGLIIYEDSLILLDKDAPFSQLRGFGEVAAHEMAHQWFGDLVTPTWWTDIWLNESFAEWMGKKTGQAWRPGLGIGATELDDAFDAMNTDALGKGRPIRQTIDRNDQIASSFDGITYQKGAQVVSMFETYLGPDVFRKGVQLHFQRHAYGNASAEQFFESVADAARDPKVVPALRSFTDQTGVPVVTVADAPSGITLAQARYRPLGVAPGADQSWTIPMCLARGERKACTLLDATTKTIPALVGPVPALVPNANGGGYYRFSLDDAGWDRLIPAGATLPGRDAMALADSLWADFAAGKVSFARVLAGARTLSGNPERLAAIALGYKLKELADTSLSPADIAHYRTLMASIYTPKLRALGFDPRPGAHGAEPVEKQALRQSLVPLVALEARDPALRAQLAAAGEAYLNGDTQAVDTGFRTTALRVAVQDRGVPLMRSVFARLQPSTDPLFRGQASAALAAADTREQVDAALGMAMTPGLSSREKLRILGGMSTNPAARATTIAFAEANFDKVLDGLPAFARPGIIGLYDGFCSAEARAHAETFVSAQLKTLGGGELELGQAKERITLCAALKDARGGDVSAALAVY